MDTATGINSYSSLFPIGHKAAAELFCGEVVVEEKVDGSQFSFGITEGGDLLCRSKGQQLNIEAPEKMFSIAVERVKDAANDGRLMRGAIYRGEYLRSAKHNTLAYDRVPRNNIMVFDIDIGNQQYLTPSEKRIIIDKSGFECVPVLRHGVVTSAADLRSFLDCTSALGGQKIEGVVVKNYAQFGPDKKTLMGKFVSEAFKEIHQGEWRKSNPTPTDVVDSIIASLRTPARWEKAVQHLRDDGRLEGSPKDIGALIKEVQADIAKECEDYIKDRLFTHFHGRINRAVVAGVPEWYKQRLLDQQAF